MDHYSRWDTKCNLIRIMANLATHRDCKAYLLKYNIMVRAMEWADESDPKIKFEGLRLLNAL